MTSASELFARAAAHQQAGQLQQAEQLCAQVLSQDAAHADTLHLLGMITALKGQVAAGARLIQQAITSDGSRPLFHFNLGVVIQQLGDLAAAAQCYRNALQLKPDYADALVNLGGVQKAQGDLEGAIASFRNALRIRPDYAEVCGNLGTALTEAGRTDEALACLRNAVQIKPEYWGGHFNLGNALRQQGDLDAAVACYRQALRIKPDYLKAQVNLAVALTDQRQLQEARQCYEQVLRAEPGYLTALSNLGSVLRELGELPQAVAYCQQAIDRNPQFARGHHNLATAQREQGKLRAAVDSYRRAIQIDPDYALAHSNLGMTLLLMGDLQTGWSEYEWRLKCSGSMISSSCQPRWDGTPLAGRTLMLFAEQGLGDTLQFIRYARQLSEQGARILVECQAPLVTILQSCVELDRVVPRGSSLPAFDVAAPLMSLPHLLGSRWETLPAEVPYLAAEPALIEQWRQRLQGIPGFKVGIAWQGNQEFRGDQWRSIPLACFEPLSQVADVTLINLQKGPGVEQLQQLPDRFRVHKLSDELDETAGPFMDTAAIMKSLDLVVTSDSATAHLAGALGVTVWVALQTIPDWRWLQDRPDSPWYPTMRLFRQTQRGSWDDVFQDMAAELARVRT